jgi:hypothetical protein
MSYMGRGATSLFQACYSACMGRGLFGTTKIWWKSTRCVMLPNEWDPTLHPSVA